MIQIKVNSSASGEDQYVLDPELVLLDFSIESSADGWKFKFANRDLSAAAHGIDDAFAIHCKAEQDDYWYLNVMDAYLRGASGCAIKDVAYEQGEDSLYVVFDDDNHLYRFDNIGETADS